MIPSVPPRVAFSKLGHKLKTFACAVFLAAAISPGLAQGNFDKVEIKVTKVAGSIYMLEGAGGNIGVSVGEDGIVLVDDQFAPLAPKIRAALKGISDKPIKFVLNTHFHGDHTGGNSQFGTEATIIAHENVRERLKNGGTVGGSQVPAAPKEALPVVTFNDRATVHVNGEDIRAIHFPNGHTDGDSVIFFTQSKVVHMGDDFVTYGFPFVDLASGGSVEGMTKNIGTVIAKLPADVKIIPGHGPLSTLDDLKKFHQMLVETSDIVRKQMQAGKNLDEIKAAGLPAKYDALGKGFINTPIWIETIFKSLSKSAGK